MREIYSMRRERRGRERSGKRQVGGNYIESARYFEGDIFYGEGK